MKLVKVKIGKKIFYIKDCKGVSSIRGLMFDDMKHCDGALIYANSIWMPFVKNKLKLVFLDDKMKVMSSEISVPISLDFNTWKTYKNEKAKYCLELKHSGLKVRKNQRLLIVE